MKVILPGSYDPITLGHLDLIRRAAEIYSEVYVVAFINPEKSYTFTEEERRRMLALATEDIKGVRVDFSSGRVVDYMKSHGIERIVKGYRNDVDLEYERRQAEYNLKFGGYVEVDDDHHITLTSSGREIAIGMLDRHNTLSTMLMKIGVSKETAISDACKIEHDLSDETIACIKSFFNI